MGKKMGRPPLGRDARKVFVGLKVSPAELTEWKRRAKASGVSLSEYILQPRREELNP